uniref:Uncharacterized protein n=1 Tax=Amphimedon queenslandica TaxID=400682 RepID=A0A1X7TM28_AMPQE
MAVHMSQKKKDISWILKQRSVFYSVMQTWLWKGTKLMFLFQKELIMRQQKITVILKKNQSYDNTKVTKPTNFYGTYITATVTDLLPEPTTAEEALSGPEKDKRKEAIKGEAFS